MRYFAAVMLIIVSVFLWLIPLPSLAHEFAVHPTSNTFTVVTGGGDTTATVHLLNPVFNGDTSTITINSSLNTDSPAFTSYTPTGYIVAMSGLSVGSSRTITVTYDYWALPSETILSGLFSFLYYVWILVLIALPVGAIVLMFVR